MGLWGMIVLMNVVKLNPFLENRGEAIHLDSSLGNIEKRTWRERVEREVGGGIGMGKTCKLKDVSFQCMTKFNTKKKKKLKKK